MRLVILLLLGIWSSNLYAQKVISSNPNSNDEGIWFVIQNKSQVDNDFTVPAQRMALGVLPNGNIQMSPIPMTGNYDAFLWRTISVGAGKYKLLNKAMGDHMVLGSTQTAMQFEIASNALSQNWSIDYSYYANDGTNAFMLSNDLIGYSKSFQLKNSSTEVTNYNVFSKTQIWLFQPMELVAGYQLPRHAEHTEYRRLTLEHGFSIVATPSTSDWALLNAHLIYKNMFNALTTSAKNSFGNGAGKQRTVVIISKDDPASIATSSPFLIMGGYQEEWIAQFRGGAQGDGITVITEEMMHKVGVYTREGDNTYREFDQVIHEMGHNVDVILGLQANTHPAANNSSEWFPYQNQLWFNAQFNNGSANNRASIPGDIYNYLSNYFSASNTWLPPRNLRGDNPAYIPPCSQGSVLYVNQGVSTSGNGSSWSNAFKTFEEALQLAQTCADINEIRIAKGIYYPTNNHFGTERDKTFAITRSNLKILGGYDAATGMRDWQNNITILSGDIGVSNNSNDNSYHVVVIGDISESSTDSLIFDGFTIRDGNANGNGNVQINHNYFYRNNGGGIHIKSTKMNTVLRNLIVSNNNGEDGGGISSHGGSFLLEKVTIQNNTASANGGGLLVYGGSSPLIRNVVFKQNASPSGGAIRVTTSSAPIIESSLFENNSADHTGGAIYSSSAALRIENSTFKLNETLGTNSSGGAIVAFEGSFYMNQTVFESNKSYEYGGAIYLNTISNNATIRNSVFVENEVRGVYGSGGGVYLSSTNPGLFVNNIFYGNRAISGGAIFLSASQINILNNSILNNTVTNNGSAIYQYQTDPSLSAFIRNTIVVGNTGGMASLEGTPMDIAYSIYQDGSIDDKGNNLQGNPTFSNLSNPKGPDGIWFTDDDGLRLNPSSIGIDQGFNFANSLTIVDIAKQHRIQNGVSDMGAYEYQGPGVALPTVDILQNYCGSKTVADLLATGTNLKWYNTELGGESLSSSTPLISGKYYVTQTINLFESKKVVVDVEVNSLEAPQVEPLLLCGVNTVGNTLIKGESYLWFEALVGGSALDNSTIITTGTYYLAKEINGCITDRTAVIVTVNTVPAPPIVTNFVVCGSAAVISSLPISVENLLWYTEPTGGTPLAFYASVGSGTYYVSQTIDGCESERTAVTITVNITPVPEAATTQSFGTPATVANLVAAGSNIKWYLQSIGGDPLLTTTSLKNGTYYVSQTIDDCESERVAVVVAAASIKYVKEGGAGNKSGLSWEDASDDLQLMLNESVSGDEVWVAKGKYIPIRSATNTANISYNNRSNAFVLQKDVKLYGGFIGTETQLSQRVLIESNSSVLSGDFNGDDTYSMDAGKPSFSGNSENAHHVVIIAGNVGSALLDGFTIQGGNANIDAEEFINFRSIGKNIGGGIMIKDAVVSVSNCIVQYNYAKWHGGGIEIFGPSYPTLNNITVRRNLGGANGGGMGVRTGYVTLKNSLIEENYTNNSGGGISLETASIISIDSTIIINNSTYYAGGGTYSDDSRTILINSTVENNSGIIGGGIASSNRSMLNIENSEVKSNSTSGSGGGIFLNNSIVDIRYSSIDNNSSTQGGGGGLSFTNNSQFNIYNVTIRGNSIPTGGGLNLHSSIGSVYNSIITGNRATAFGGGIENRNNSNLELVNVTIAGNSAGSEGYAIFNNENSSITIKNSIVHGNVNADAAIRNYNGASVTYENSMSEGNTNTDALGNINTINPLFVNPISSNSAPTSLGNYQLQSCSPLLNLGNKNHLPLDASVRDLSGAQRIYLNEVDMGAFEFQGWNKGADILGQSNDVGEANITGATMVYVNNSSCKELAYIVPSGSSPISSITEFSTYIVSDLIPIYGKKYARRYYSINPANNGSTATATITLFFTQLDFNHFNENEGASVLLPTYFGDNANKQNIKILKVNEQGQTQLLNTQSTWNDDKQRWEVTFNVVGFSDFFLGASDASPLPLTLLSFKAAEKDCNTILEWQTTNETGFSHFEIETSRNGVTFETVQITRAKGSILSTNQYVETLPILAGKNYYRLKMVDIDGQFSYSDVKIVEASCANTVRIYPNPTESTLFVSGAKLGASYQVLDNAGKIVLQGKLQSNSVNVQAISAGVYILRIFDEHGIKDYLPFIKQ